MKQKIKLTDLEKSKAFEEYVARKVEARMVETEKQHKDEIAKWEQEIAKIKKEAEDAKKAEAEKKEIEEIEIESEQEQKDEKELKELSNDELIDEISKEFNKDR